MYPAVQIYLIYFSKVPSKLPTIQSSIISEQNLFVRFAFLHLPEIQKETLEYMICSSTTKPTERFNCVNMLSVEFLKLFNIMNMNICKMLSYQEIQAIVFVFGLRFANSGILKFITSMELEANERYRRKIRFRLDSCLFHISALILLTETYYWCESEDDSYSIWDLVRILQISSWTKKLLLYESIDWKFEEKIPISVGVQVKRMFCWVLTLLYLIHGYTEYRNMYSQSS